MGKGAVSQWDVTRGYHGGPGLVRVGHGHIILGKNCWGTCTSSWARTACLKPCLH